MRRRRWRCDAAASRTARSSPRPDLFNRPAAKIRACFGQPDRRIPVGDRADLGLRHRPAARGGLARRFRRRRAPDLLRAEPRLRGALHHRQPRRARHRLHRHGGHAAAAGRALRDRRARSASRSDGREASPERRRGRSDSRRRFRRLASQTTSSDPPISGIRPSNCHQPERSVSCRRRVAGDGRTIAPRNERADDLARPMRRSTIEPAAPRESARTNHQYSERRPARDRSSLSGSSCRFRERHGSPPANAPALALGTFRSGRAISKRALQQPEFAERAPQLPPASRRARGAEVVGASLVGNSASPGTPIGRGATLTTWRRARAGSGRSRRRRRTARSPAALARGELALDDPIERAAVDDLGGARGRHAGDVQRARRLALR